MEEKFTYDFEGKENKTSADLLRQGLIGKITGYGQSMTPILKNGQSVICIPVTDDTELSKNDIVLCKVKGHYYLHLIWSVKTGDRFMIGNNHGRQNGIIGKNNIYGKVVEKL